MSELNHHDAIMTASALAATYAGSEAGKIFAENGHQLTGAFLVVEAVAFGVMTVRERKRNPAFQE